ncbi:MAG: osmotically inducible protein OsmC [gamma proteobacterium symbiont of Ctena orbiculata]|uniref:OsmC family protein n=1 Tax=Candidatus Thiodiazotropha taylori TaxID=2792791 RepID=A0A944M6A4_9GAMM|nr:OsmC family protein [Candidatus Thiodiazotropha taylori]PUB81579.1 MAG: osmotically inducible protein OsmC [gamma proteobacterium symbiont of Ctena orbiculata]MBT2988766.1 OsmC family protein [Candidatus Thiodiazotropha taylori]MBT2998623.1 OsmC family protein [Candidatus Thiodiazotropha taylori]MBT3001461.1 OsmC family protein [Candidatus Thiodiazotropha taylori]
MESIKVSFQGGKRIHAEVGGYTIETDQPVKYGGEASAPAPFDLFLASLATCAGIYAWNFCESRKLSTADMDLQMDCMRDEKRKMIVKVIFRLKLPTGFPDRYRDGIIKAMELCAVKKHIQDTPDFSVELG